MAPLISFRGVGHTYRPWFGRPVRAVDDFSLEIGAGEVVGIAGPNGAGKTTLIAMLLGFLAPTNGDITIAGLRPRAYVERRGVGYLPELMALPTFWRADSALRRLGTLAGVPAAELDRAVVRGVERMGLDEHRRKRLKALSKGNFQRLGLAQALLCDNDVMVFDEPTHGLDPLWANDFQDVVAELRRPGRAIFIASHNLDELERLCDRVAIIDHGRMQRVVNIADADVAATAWVVRLTAGADQLAAHFPSCQPLPDGSWLVRARDLDALNRALGAAIGAGARVGAVTPHESSLEHHFREAVRR